MQGPTLIAGVSAELALTISAGLVLTPAASASPALIAGVSGEVALTISAGLALGRLAASLLKVKRWCRQNAPMGPQGRLVPPSWGTKQNVERQSY